ncbi:MAG: hypothetical protein KDF60_03360 [Calditrichaeota bacterium]|nr:hypothetical protein [Calditrichota bacterium]
MKSATIAVLFISILTITACEKTLEEQMQEYLEFYFPTTGQNSYEIVFEWGHYTISTGATANEELHPDSEPYRGYITMRPVISDSSKVQNLPTYLVTPKGEVWRSFNTKEIRASSHREEITVEKTDTATNTTTVTIESVSEPVIDNFQENRQNWEKYGKLEAAVGGGSVFTAVKP